MGLKQAAAGALRAIGLMSGTSLDGVDVALVESDGNDVAALGPTGYRPYTEAERALLRQALQAAAALTDRNSRPGVVAAAEAAVTAAHAEAVEAFLDAHRLAQADVDIVGFHGQTVLHRPERRLTIQIGDGGALARRLGIAVAFDFRAADVAAGGQGAPLVPVYHRALAARLDRPQPLAVLNVGGVANVTCIDGDGLIACDTGPGNALIDDFMQARAGEPCDRDGAQAARGRVDEALVAAVLQHPFFARPAPKSLDRNDFTIASLDLARLSVADGAATLTALTAAAVARIVAHLPRAPKSWLVAGGGARNPALLAMLAARLAPARVEPAAAVGWSGDALEAQAFAYLAVRSLRGLPITFPSTTGTRETMTGGVVVQPSGRQRSSSSPA
jgi:anhydro-N-acetylmuramic acid kinase